MITYQAQDDCGYTATCSFQVLIDIDPLSGKVVLNNPNELALDATQDEQADDSTEEDDTVEETEIVTDNEIASATIVVPQSDEVNVYPNPVSDILNIIIPTDRNILSLQMISAEGKIISNNTNINPGHQIMDLSSFDRGLYIMMIQYSDGHRDSLRIMKM